MPQPFTLPEAPVDGYELRWFHVVGDYDADLLRIEEIRAVYHVDAPWAVVCPDRDAGGAPFKNDWQIFRNGDFVGRNDGWPYPLRTEWNGHYATREEAVAELKRRLRERLAYLEKSRADVMEKLRKLEHACT